MQCFFPADLDVMKYWVFEALFVMKRHKLRIDGLGFTEN